MSQVPTPSPDQTPAAPAAAVPAATFTPEQFQSLIGALAAQGFNRDDLKAILSETSRATMKAMRPENDTHPGKSAMSYPEGDEARPRPRLEHQLLWNGYPQHKFQEELHWSELELITGRRTEPDGSAQVIGRGLRAGKYEVSLKDGSLLRMAVEVKHDPNDRIERIEAYFINEAGKRTGLEREYKERLCPFYVTLYQMVHADTMKPRESFMKGMARYIEVIYADEDAKRSDAVAV